MKVKLIAYTKEAMDLMARMGRSTKLGYLPEEWDDKWGTREFFIRALMKAGHLGILEHIVFTFHVSGISRNLTHQLVRHRLASYLQQSNRSVQPGRDDFVLPPTIGKTVHETQHYKEWMQFQWDNYQSMIKMGIPVEDARYLLPSGYFTHISITMNARVLRHLFKLRCDKAAQWEIRQMADEMLEQCRKIYPIIFENIEQEGG